MVVTRNARRTVEGTVSSSKMTKTITVVVERTFKHPKYMKYVRKRKKYHAHDEESVAREGDRVEIVQCRPTSKLKRWRLVRVLERAKVADAIQIDADISFAKVRATDGGGA